MKIIIDFGQDLESQKFSNDNIEETQFHVKGLTKGKFEYAGVFITHSHSDYIGLAYTTNKDIPIYIEEKSFVIYNILCDFKKNGKY